MKLGLSETEALELARRYGSNTDAVYELAKLHKDEADQAGLPVSVLAPLLYAIEQEMAATPADFFIRRTGALFFRIDWVRKWKEPVISFMAQRLGWTQEETLRYADDLEKHLHDAVVPLEKEEFEI
jgi:glycerol-3-phosphate dehydrogenase